MSAPATLLRRLGGPAGAPGRTGDHGSPGRVGRAS
ncbi:hypothetical protein GTY87_08625 [Streptomyces sp. SID7813]|uniref:Uncharacterized protein n=1 Tax=Streptomyces coelicolor (strain ATCC BAA-471 / A3(2) / M145) TaxID=100226 RepID=Q9S2B7_STRCO|nr:hypothetical protein [Streptomyces sp. SID7813]QFI41904.1 hypothetical protein FQ762_08715 [Streptomyces coelicolor A3(2)]THA99165.1 hypothetical protein E6R61_04405 [Streptomyces sp. LRa12]CAB50928.1 hypothetical protein [Streptomyces coelicolor A3(2)]